MKNYAIFIKFNISYKKGFVFIYSYMNFLFKGEVVDYDFFNAESKHTILFLHGWGGDKNSFVKICNLLKHNYNILTLTMPTIKKTNFVWTLCDYANLVKSLFDALNIKSVTIICHSFGFRVACFLRGKIDIEKIIITGGAGLKRENIFRRIKSYNNAIWLKKDSSLYDRLASTDYKALSLTNKITFKNIVNINTHALIKFGCPMLLFWGKVDTSTPVWMAKKIARTNKKNCKLVITNSDHFAFLLDSDYFNNEVIKFLSI